MENRLYRNHLDFLNPHTEIIAWNSTSSAVKCKFNHVLHLQGLGGRLQFAKTNWNNVVANPHGWNYHILSLYLSVLSCTFPSPTPILTSSGCILHLMMFCILWTMAVLCCVFACLSRVVGCTRLTLLFPKGLLILKYHCQNTPAICLFWGFETQLLTYLLIAYK